MLSSAKMLSLSFGAALAVAASALAGGAGQQQGPISAIGPTSYLNKGDGQYFPGGCYRAGVDYYFEDFEDGLVNTTGLIIPALQREVLAPGSNTDSVDTNGRSMRASAASAGSVTLVFDEDALNGLPTEVGFVITDTNGAADTTFTLFVIDGDGNNGSFTFTNIGDGSAAATKDDDVFVGVSSQYGIQQLQILSPAQLWEIDHLQYSKNAVTALPSRGDGDASGTGDVYFHQPGAAVTAWYLNDLVQDPTEIEDVMSSSWTIQGFGDFDGDCDDDILWRNSSSSSKVQVWTLEGGLVVDKTNVSTNLASAWTVSGIGDFDGDGMADIFLENDTAKQMKIWFMDGDFINQESTVTSPNFDPSLFKVHSVGDINQDGMADIVWRKTSTGDLRYFKMSGSTVLKNGMIQAAVETAWVGVAGGDLDGNGTLDLVFRSATTGNVLLALVGTDYKVFNSAQLSLNSGFTFIGTPDVNGDGNADLVWRKNSDGKIVRWKMSGLTVLNSATIGTGPTTSGLRTHTEK
jgi:hypothetical protein